jgi:hypothetical protein
MSFYTYIHTRKTDKKVFYVGKGSGNRVSSIHQRSRMWRHVANKHGFESKILMTFEKEQDAFDHEKFLIFCFKDMGISLVNQTEGGEGSSGFKLKEETKIKISNALRMRSPEIKIKIANSLKMRSPEINKQISEKLTGRKKSEETKLKMSIAKKGVKKSEEHKKNISNAAKGRFFSEETRRKLSEAAINQHKNRREKNGTQET